MGDAAEASREGGTRVLVVEDEFFIADELRRNLTAAGLRVLGPVSSNEDALELLEWELPHVAVLDVHMGGERVTPVATKLQQLKVPFVLTTASPPHELATDPVLSDAVNLGKPTDPDILVRAILDLVK